MLSLLIFTISMALIDCLNPSTIITHCLLLIKTASKAKSILFIFIIALLNATLGIAVHYGILQFLKPIIKSIQLTHSIYLVSIELILMVTLTYFLFRKNSKQQGATKTFSLGFTATILLAISTTISDFPTAIPYFSFIAKVEFSTVALMPTIGLFLLYNTIYVLPLIIIHLVYIFKTNFFNLHFTKLEKIINRVLSIVLKIILAISITFIAYDIIRYCTKQETILKNIFS